MKKRGRKMVTGMEKAMKGSREMLRQTFMAMYCRPRNQWDAPDAPDHVWVPAVSETFEAVDAANAEVIARRLIRWLSPADEIRMQVSAGSGLGTQLWEPCERCGDEPSYMQQTGHLCVACAGTAHPQIPGTQVPTYSRE